MARTTKLQAVNTVLSAVGITPVNSLSDTSQDASLAENTINEVSKNVQSYGWAFNTEYDVELTVDGNSKIPVPINALKVDVNDSEAGDGPILQRGDYLYNTKEHTYIFTSSKKCTIIYELDFTELPEPARHFIMIRSARIFQDRYLSSQQLHAYTKEDEIRAQALMEQHEIEVGDYNMRDSLDGHIRRIPYNSRRFL